MLLKLLFFSGSNVYIQLFHFYCTENNLFIANKTRLLNRHIAAWEKCLIYKKISDGT